MKNSLGGGFDDVIILISGSGADSAMMSDMQNAGMDAVFAYSWGALAV